MLGCLIAAQGTFRLAPREGTVDGRPFSPLMASAFAWSRSAPLRYEVIPTLDRDAVVYRLLQVELGRHGNGPLFEVPTTGFHAVAATIGRTVHRQPSILSSSGHVPLHVALVQRLVARLPDVDALDDLVDMTGLRWILVRPEVDWRAPGDRGRFLAALRRHHRWLRSIPLGPFSLEELDPSPRYPAWFDAVRSGVRPGFTVLGTPLRPLEPRPGAGAIQAVAPPRAPAGRAISVQATVSNTDVVPWPAASPQGDAEPFTVHVELAWTRDAPETSLPAPVVTELQRDLMPGERTSVSMLVSTPTTPGRYELEVVLRQRGSAVFASAIPPVRIPLEVVASEGD